MARRAKLPVYICLNVLVEGRAHREPGHAWPAGGGRSPDHGGGGSSGGRRREAARGPGGGGGARAGRRELLAVLRQRGKKIERSH